MMFKQAVKSTDENLRRVFPSIFAEAKQEGLSDRYLYVPTFKLIEGLESQGFEIVGAKQSKARSQDKREHTKHVVYLSHPSMIDSDGMTVGDERPMLALTNSHNGTSALAFDTAFFRLVCSNGLLMPSSAINSARVIHKVGMEHDVLDAAYRVITALPEQVRQIETMKQVKLSEPERMLLASSAARLAFDESQIELNAKIGNDIVSKLVRPRRMADSGADLWSTFNVIQENIIKGGLRIVAENEQGQRRIQKTRAVGAIDRDSKLNKELMRLAQEMASLKTA